MNEIKLTFTITLCLILNSTFSQNYIKDFQSVGEMVSIGDTLYFTATDDIHGSELWRSDGTFEGTYLIKEIYPGYYGSNPTSLIVHNNEIYFAADDGVHGNELWKSDGTEKGTVMVSNIKPDSQPYGGGSYPGNLTIYNGNVFFIASDDGNDGDLWETNGTLEGTVKVLETNYIGIGELTVAGNSLFFVRYYGSHQLWKYDGISGIAVQISIDDYYTIADLNSFNDALYFITHTSYKQNIRLYRLDASENLTLLKEFTQPAYGFLDIDNFTKVNQDIFFSVRTDYDTSPETDVLWKTDGTASGTVMVKEFGWEYHYSDSYMCNFIEYKNALFFRSGSKNNFALFTSDGTNAGTNKVADAVMRQPVISNNLLYFSGSLGIYGDNELMMSDGTSAGTEYFANLNQTGNSNPANFQDVNGLLYFTIDIDGVVSLWNTLDNPDIVVKNGWNNLESDNTVSFNTTKAGTILKKVLTIENTGRKELIISGIYVSGQDFYINSKCSVLNPKQKDTIQIQFFPTSEGIKKGQVTINSNDNDEGAFIINLEGTVLGKESSPSLINTDVNLIKKIDFADVSDTLYFSSNSFNENIPANSEIGNFNIIGGNSEEYSYSLVQGTGDENNSEFYIQNNTLYTNKTFDFEIRNTISIRVKASNNDGKVYERFITLKINDIKEPFSFNECGKRFYNLSYSLNDVCFINEETVFAVGDDGIILKSIDAGNNWVPINSATRASLYKLQFVSEDVGYIIGGYGDILLKTENGGSNWFPLDINNPGYPYIQNFHFISKDKGIVVGGQGKIFKTTDGGRTWNFKSIGFDDIYAAYLINESVGFICGSSNILYKTNDFGENWIKINMDNFGWNNRFKDIYFTDQKTGYILCENGAVLKTTDTGNSWSQVSKVVTDYATNIYFVNQNIGFITCGWSWSNIYKTEDAGITWKKNNYEKYGSLSGISFNSNGQKGCIVGDASGYGSTSQSGRLILNSVNYGNDWTSKANINGSYDFYDVSFFDDNTGYVAAGIYNNQGTIYKTLDNGITWNQLSFTPPANVKKCHFINKDTVYAIADSVYLTTNGGNTWKGDSYFNKYYNYFFVDFENIYYEYNGKIYKSIDSGKTWNLTYSSNNWFSHIYFHNKNLGFLLGYELILKTEDGGLTWSEYRHNLGKILKTIYFIGNDTILIGGNDGALLKSTDRGNSWNKISSIIGIDILDFEFYDHTNGIAITNNDGGLSNIYSTDDQGETWKFIEQISENVYKAFSQNNETFIVGGRGSFYKYSQSLPPSQAGYILGNESACIGDIIKYTASKSAYFNYIWEIPNLPNFLSANNYSEVTWENEGEYQIKLTPINECGQGLYQLLNIKVEGLPNPLITGKDTVYKNEANVIYLANILPDDRKSWYLKGSKSATFLNENEISINWGDSTNGKIELIQTTPSGCNQKTSKSITILAVTNTPELNQDIDIKVFPNPGSDIINIIIPDPANDNYSAKIYSYSGALMNSFNILDTKTIINVGDFPKGMYILKVINNIGQINKTLKIVIE